MHMIDFRNTGPAFSLNNSTYVSGHQWRMTFVPFLVADLTLDQSHFAGQRESIIPNHLSHYQLPGRKLMSNSTLLIHDLSSVKINNVIKEISRAVRRKAC